MPEGSKTVDQALRVLEQLRGGGPGTAADLGRRIGISRTAAGRLLISLEEHGFVRRTDAGFDLGFDLLRFSSALGAGIRAAAVAPLQRLAARFDETAVLAVRDGNDAVAIEQIAPGERVVNIQYRPGTRHPLSVGAHGLAMLADVHVQVQELEPALVPRLAEIARIGYAVSRDELEPGVTGIAAPIVSVDDTPIAAIGIVAPSNRFPDVAAVAHEVTTAARTITAELIGTPRRDPARTG